MSKTSLSRDTGGYVSNNSMYDEVDRSSINIDRDARNLISVRDFNLDNKSYVQLKKSRTEQNRGIYGRSFLDRLSSSVVARFRRNRITPSLV